MRLPRDLTGRDLAAALGVLGYDVTRQSGSHLRLTTLQRGEHSITVPAHNPLRIGTLAAILADVGGHHDLTRQELIAKLFSN